MRALTASMRAGLSGPRFEPPEAAALYGCGDVADGRLQKYFGSLKLWPISAEPTALPLLTIRLPRGLIAGRRPGRDACNEERIDDPGDERQEDEQHDGRTNDCAHARRVPQVRAGKHQAQVDELDAGERNQDAARAHKPADCGAGARRRRAAGTSRPSAPAESEPR